MIYKALERIGLYLDPRTRGLTSREPGLGYLLYNLRFQWILGNQGSRRGAARVDCTDYVAERTVGRQEARCGNSRPVICYDILDAAKAFVYILVGNLHTKETYHTVWDGAVVAGRSTLGSRTTRRTVICNWIVDPRAGRDKLIRRIHR